VRTTVMAGPTSNYTARVEISVMGEPTPITTEHFPTTESLYRPAFRASEGGVRRGDQPNRHSYQRGKQNSAFGKVPRCMLLVSQESLRVLKRKASPRSQSYENQLTGFPGKRLSLRSLTAEVMGLALPLTFGRSFFLLFQDRAQVWATIALAASHGGPNTYVVAVPLSCLIGFGQRTTNIDNGVPLPFVAHDLSSLAKLCPGVLQGSVERPVLLSGQVELAPSGQSLNVYPEVKACGLAWLLHLGGITKLSPKVGQFQRFGAPLLLESSGSLSGPFVISDGPVTYSLLKFTFASLTLALKPELTFLGYYGVQEIKLPMVFSLKVTTKHSQQVGLDPGGIELDTIGQRKRLVWGVLHSTNTLAGR